LLVLQLFKQDRRRENPASRGWITDVNRITTIAYQAFGEPSYDTPTRIEGEENQLTVISRDLFGKISSVTQSGSWSSYGYGYDPLNNLRSRTGPNALTYSYNATTNRLAGISGSQTRSYGYNARGEITGDGTKSFTLNAKGQISGITGIAAYGYDVMTHCKPAQAIL